MWTLLLFPSAFRHASFNSLSRLSRSALRFSSTSSNLSAYPPTGRTYANAIKLLDTLQSNQTITSAISSTPHDMNATAIPEMLEWTRKAGYEPSDFAKHGLKFIHVAGTKGKGSVCIMAENILLNFRNTQQNSLLGKIGLYTSPHLIHVRERIRIDGSPISEAMFTRYFFEIWDRISSANARDGISKWKLPGYFRYLTLMAFHTFIQEGVGCAILECGIGGEYDSTNIIPSDAVSVCGITRLDIDHTGMLGDTLESIAWHKAGIMKGGVSAYTVEQAPDAQAVLNKRALEKGVQLTVVPENPSLKEVSLALEGSYQKQNASLAIALASDYLESQKIVTRETGGLSPGDLHALETVSWPGRCQLLREGNIEWYLDGAHTHESIVSTATWFGRKLSTACEKGEKPQLVLIFNQEGDRDAIVLLRTLLLELETRVTGFIGFDYAAFCTNQVWEKNLGNAMLNLKSQRQLGEAYRELTTGGVVCDPLACVEEAVGVARVVGRDSDRVMVLVTGSLHLVGGVLEIVDVQSKEAEQEAEAERGAE